MNTKCFKITLFLFIILFTNLPSIYSLDVKTHKAINETVAKGIMNGFSLDSYLINNLGIGGGVSEYFKDKDQNNNRVYDWLKLGGEYEDKPPWTLPYVRSVNHFHNPLKTNLTEAGFTGI